MENRGRKVPGETLRRKAERIPLSDEDCTTIQFLLAVQHRGALPGRYGTLLRSVLFRGSASELG
jgi:hypothetical protein